MTSLEDLADHIDEGTEISEKSWQAILAELSDALCTSNEKRIIADAITNLLIHTPNQEEFARKVLTSAQRPDIISLLNRCRRIASAYEYIANIDDRQIAGHTLRPTQKEAALGFYYWLRKGVLSKQGPRGTIIKPTATGKTYTAALLAEMMPRKVVFLALSNDEVAKTHTDFNRHFGSSEQVQTLLAGKACPKETKILITKFHQAMSGAIDSEFWTQVDLLIVDEADINGLSDERRTFIQKLSEEYGFPIVAMSATEQQGSGKRLEHVYPDSIARIPMPEGLPLALDMGIIAPTRFVDLYCPASVGIDMAEVISNGDLHAQTVSELIKNPEWFATVIDHYIKHFKRPSRHAPGVILVRDNQAIPICIAEAEKHGIKVAAYTGETDASGLERLRSRLKNGEIDLLIGSRLPGRGMNIEEIEVVYNCLLTYSPQLFWQGGGRALRRHGDKNATVVAVMPAKIHNTRTGKALPPPEWPLRHATFFDPHYFDDGAETPEMKFELNQSLPIRSIDTVVKVIKRHFDTHIRYNRAEILAALVNASRELNLGAHSTIRLLTQISNETGKKIAKNLQNMNDDVQKGATPINPNVERLLRKFAPDKKAGEVLTKQNEREWLQTYHLHKESPNPTLQNLANEVAAKLFRCVSPLVIAIAQKFATGKAGVDDLFQEGYIAFTQALNNYDATKKGAFANYLLYYLHKMMVRYIHQVETALDVPPTSYEALRKVTRLKESGKDLDTIADELKRQRGTLRDLWNATNNVETGAEEGGDEIIPGCEWSHITTPPDDPEEFMEHRTFWPYLYQKLFFDTDYDFTPMEKRIIIYSTCEGMSLREIGELYNLDPESIRTLLKRGLKRLKNRLRLEGEDISFGIPTTIEEKEILLQMTGLKNKVIPLADEYFTQYGIKVDMIFHVYWQECDGTKKPHVKLKDRKNKTRQLICLDDLGINLPPLEENTDVDILCFVSEAAHTSNSSL